MRFPRRPTRWLAGLLTGSLLFAQLAVAAYACPAEARHDAGAAAAAMAAMPDCHAMAAQAGADPEAMDPAQPQLCKAHCEQGQQSPASAPDLNLVPTPLLLAVLDWRLPLVLHDAHASRPLQVASGAPPPGSPPLYLSLLVLRN